MIVIYTGPTLPVEKARAVLDGANYRPPIVRGDLSKLPRKTKIVGIIDGVFYSDSAVAHKEIIEVMKKGVTVVGSSSMGALRAAELADFGMIGVGRIFECYRSGRITNDDEVAVTFNPVTGEQMSEPMVNVRYQLKAAEHAGIIDPEERRAIVEMTGRIFYPQRTYENILAKSIEAGAISRAKGDRLLEFVHESPLNLKAEDAVLLLEKIRSLSCL
ncbi:TfuA-related McrA-glycine thioamidation protein [Methanocella arvoryzae]|uniref:TfuA-like core domain-containing protein n=1 Tax=Methanocella arvoryzae (strain DSM 22066 / NBRC 105507 / MRE50) TaxID=351160 RepID=Q0W323_METAR|nr:TfuA-related McrA-glycine thioamidation protein [Methanocella arvoryzae]CAJ37220.1 conserved hypothetical protein [Methanocella arvoryzae MRE50]